MNNLDVSIVFGKSVKYTIVLQVYEIIFKCYEIIRKFLHSIFKDKSSKTLQMITEILQNPYTPTLGHMMV